MFKYHLPLPHLNQKKQNHLVFLRKEFSTQQKTMSSEKKNTQNKPLFQFYCLEERKHIIETVKGFS